MMRKLCVLCLLALSLQSVALYGQAALTSLPEVKKAMDYLERNQQAHLDKQIQIAEIPAPGFHEEQRAAQLVKEFQRVGLTDVETDGIGNVLGWRKGSSPRTLVIAAHLDTVFPAGTDVKVKRKDGRLNGPGLVDDTRGLTAILALAEALNHAKIQTGRTLLFVADVGEEGLGSLRGIRYLFHEGKYRERLEAFISVDSTSDEIKTMEMGSRRYKITVKGPGGHSYLDFGRVNPIHAIGRIIDKFAQMQVPSDPKTTYNVGRIGGGTSVNSIPFECWMEVDMRSSDEGELDKLEQKLLRFSREGVDQENSLRTPSDTKLELVTEKLAVRKSARNAENAPLVRSAQWAMRQMGMKPVLAVGSTDSNAPLNMGIPAITIGGGGQSGNLHSLEEWFDPKDAYKGVQQILLTVLAYDRSIY